MITNYSYSGYGIFFIFHLSIFRLSQKVAHLCCKDSQDFPPYHQHGLTSNLNLIFICDFPFIVTKDHTNYKEQALPGRWKPWIFILSAHECPGRECKLVGSSQSSTAVSLKHSSCIRTR